MTDTNEAGADDWLDKILTTMLELEAIENGDKVRLRIVGHADAKAAITQHIQADKERAIIAELESLPQWGAYNDPYRQEIRYRITELRKDRTE